MKDKVIDDQTNTIRQLRQVSNNLVQIAPIISVIYYRN